MIRSITSCFVVASVLFGFWHYNGSSNEMEYYTFESATHAYRSCGFFSAGHDGMYIADALASGGASESISMEFNTMDGAKAFIESKCGGVK